MNRILALAAASSTVMLAAPSTAAAKVTILRTTYVTPYFQIVDHAPLQTTATQPPTPGDVALLRSRYSSGHTVVAYERTACTVIDWPHAVCDINLTLRGGHLIATDQFNAVSRATQHVAITGGTGAYRSARGQISLRQITDTRGTATFTIIT